MANETVAKTLSPFVLQASSHRGLIFQPSAVGVAQMMVFLFVNTVWDNTFVPTFRRNVLLPSLKLLWLEQMLKRRKFVEYIEKLQGLQLIGAMGRNGTILVLVDYNRSKRKG